MSRVKRITNSTGGHYGHVFYCPGCQGEHVITTLPHPNGWTFNGNEEKPTFTPSILVHAGRKWVDGGAIDTPRCHSFVTDGRIQFLGDSTHALAGQTVDLPEIDAGAVPADGGR